ncbi:MAG: electron transport complex subunit RsxC [Clostridiales bacterium]|jgi:electron transport complex protein RnfC|nr:electron transport complex subunit RsxC [Clostridiales bacterium]
MTSVPIYTFPHGIHPDDRKAVTSSEAILKVIPKAGSTLVFPMLQHLGAPCDPTVAPGDAVLLGQMIGDSQRPVSSPVHSSVSGTVKEIRQCLTPTGIVCQGVCIENDGRDQGFRPKDLKKGEIPDSQTILQLIRSAGIVGLGGAGFPTHVKLNPPPGKNIDVIIVNASECEPYLTTDHRVLLEDSHRLCLGLNVILSLFPSAKGIIAIETNKRDAIEKMLETAKEFPRIEVVGLAPKYPQGAEKQLIYACTKREVPSGGLPADIGCLVDNVDTVIAIERAVHRRRPLIRKVVTITGGAAAKPGNYEVRLGMRFSDLMEAVGGFKSEPYKVIAGGPMMGVAMFDMDVPIIKTSSAFLLFTEEEGKLPSERTCIRCGKCVEHCPMSLMPFELNQYAVRHEEELFAKNNGLDCIECGSCSYICPAKRHLAQSIRSMRRDLMSRGKK